MSSRLSRSLIVLAIMMVGFLSLVAVASAQEPAVDPDADKGKPNPPAGAFNLGPSARPAGVPILRGEGEFIPIPPQCTSNTVSASRNNAIPIPNTGTPLITSTLFVAFEIPYIWDMAVTTPISHTFSGDIDMTLQSPDGRIVTLSTDNGAGNNNVFGNVEWYDFADLDGTLPYTQNAGLVTDHPYADNVGAGTLHPEESFGGFIGEGTGTTWTLTLNDDANQDGGVLNGWGLSFLALNQTPNTIFNSFPSTDPAATIPEQTLFTRTITVSGMPGVLHTIELNGLISHTNNADLDITLTAPDGRVATLTTDNGGSNDNVFVDTQWADRFSFSGQIPYTNTPALTTDRLYANNVNASGLVPEESMSMFRGTNPNGTWTLTIVDDTVGNTGTLNGWTLDMLTATCEEVAPEIGVSDTAYSVTHDPAPTVSFDDITVTNTGNDNLSYSISEIPAGGGGTISEKTPVLGGACANSGDIPWLDVGLDQNPELGGGSLPPGGSETTDMMFKSFGLDEGVYTGTLCISSDDPDEGEILIPLTLTVNLADPAIGLAATVGTTSGVCAGNDTITVAPGTAVYYCYTVTNSGDITLPLHTLGDTLAGTILSNFPFALGPGDSVDTVAAGLEISATLNTTTTNTGSWTAFGTDRYGRIAGTGNFIDISATGTEVITDADDSSITTTLPFTFTYFGAPQTEVCVSSNGHLQFGTDSCTRFSNGLLPFNDYKGVVAVAWDDYVIPDLAGSAVLVETQGSAPNRVFIAQWENVRAFSGDTSDLGTFQARLEEDGDIVFAYEDMDFDGTEQDNGLSATVGLSDDGLDARVYSANEANSIANGSSLSLELRTINLTNTSDFTTVNVQTPTAVTLSDLNATATAQPLALLLLAGVALVGTLLRLRRR
jgi:subtilisin-like proprotein convertase family protein